MNLPFEGRTKCLVDVSDYLVYVVLTWLSRYAYLLESLDLSRPAQPRHGQVLGSSDVCKNFKSTEERRKRVLFEWSNCNILDRGF